MGRLNWGDASDEWVPSAGWLSSGEKGFVSVFIRAGWPQSRKQKLSTMRTTDTLRRVTAPAERVRLGV